MSLELSSIGGFTFDDMREDEKRAIIEAVRRAEVLEKFHREATQLATYVEGLEADLHLHGIVDRKLLDPIRRMVVYAEKARDELASGIDDYRRLLRDVPRAMGFVGTFIQLLKQARTGEVDAINELTAAREELGLVEPSAASAPQESPGATMADLFKKTTTPEERQLAIRTYPVLDHAFALEESIAQAARDRLAPDAYQAFMTRIRDNIAKDINEGRPLPAVANVAAVAGRNA